MYKTDKNKVNNTYFAAFGRLDINTRWLKLQAYRIVFQNYPFLKDAFSIYSFKNEKSHCR